MSRAIEKMRELATQISAVIAESTVCENEVEHAYHVKGIRPL